MSLWQIIRRKKWLLVPLGLLLVGLAVLLAALLRDLARQALERLIFASQVTARYAETLPQPAIWILLVATVVAILVGSLFGWQTRRGAVHEEGRRRQGPVGNWTRIMGRASERSTLREYYRWRLARDLALLAANTLSYTRRISLAEARHLLDSGTLEASAEIRAYLQAGRTDPPDHRFPLLRHLLGRGGVSPLKLDPEQVIAFLEKEMEL